MSNNYNSKDIVILEGLDAVRLRPGMYIGTTGVKGMHHLLWEIVDNSIDEIANGYGDKITIIGTETSDKDGIIGKSAYAFCPSLAVKLSVSIIVVFLRFNDKLADLPALTDFIYCL